MNWWDYIVTKDPNARIDTTPEPGMAADMARLLLATGMAWALPVPPEPPVPPTEGDVAGNGMVVGADEFGGYVADPGAMYYPAGGLRAQPGLPEIAKWYKEDEELVLILQMIANAKNNKHKETA